MATMFENVIVRLYDLGFITFILPFLMVTAIFYGMLRKSQVFGKPDENVVVNAIVAIVAGFMVLAYPIISAPSGVEVGKLFADFFFKASIGTLTVMLGLLIAGMFLPADLPAKIASTIGSKGRGVGLIVVGSLIVIGIAAASSGILALFLPSGFTFPAFNFAVGSAIDETTLLSMVMIIAMSMAVIGIVWGSGKGSPKT
jgi:hypothetical protein